MTDTPMDREREVPDDEATSRPPDAAPTPPVPSQRPAEILYEDTPTDSAQETDQVGDQVRHEQDEERSLRPDARNGEERSSGRSDLSDIVPGVVRRLPTPRHGADQLTGAGAAGDAVAGARGAADAVGAAGDAAKAAGAAGGAAQAAGAAAGGTGASLAGDALAGGRAVSEGDVMGAGEAAARAAATAAATAAGSPALGGLVNWALRTEVGRKISRLGFVWIVLGTLMPFILILATIVAANTVVGALFTTVAGQALCVDPSGGGIPITEPTKLARATEIARVAYQRGYGSEGAVIGLMTAITESSLDPTGMDALQPKDTPPPLLSVGLFQQKPFYWATEFWPAGTVVGDANFKNPIYLTQARAAIASTPYAAGKFFNTFEADGRLKGGKWKDLEPWVVAQDIQRSAFPDGSNYAANLPTARSTLATVLANDPTLKALAKPTPSASATSSLPAAPVATVSAAPSPATTDAGGKGGCAQGQGIYGGYGDYTIPADQQLFKDGGVVYPNTAKAMVRANSVIGHAEIACADRQCKSLCDHLSGWIWGYDASGYYSAKVHWGKALTQGIAHPGGLQPPIGALLFWDTGVYGHVATYIGNGYVVSNMVGPNGANVYKVAAVSITRDWGAPYLGWADPSYYGQAPGAGL